MANIVAKRGHTNYLTPIIKLVSRNNNSAESAQRLLSLVTMSKTRDGQLHHTQ